MFILRNNKKINFVLWIALFSCSTNAWPVGPLTGNRRYLQNNDIETKNGPDLESSFGRRITRKDWNQGIQNGGILTQGIQDQGIQDQGIQDRGIQDRGIQDQGIRDRGILDQGIQDQGIQDQGIQDQGLMDQGNLDVLDEDSLKRQIMHIHGKLFKVLQCIPLKNRHT